jgi:protein-S-isoprenylcysteine O-methyltransferase Ste14
VHGDSLERRIPPVAFCLLLALGMWAAARGIPGLALELPGRAWLAALGAVGGAALIAPGVGAFRRAGTTVNPLTPEASGVLVTAGIYAYTRNPMYLGMLLLLFAWAAWLAHAFALLLAALFVPYMNRFQIQPEERVLAARFGDDYAAYRRRVRRWI